MTLVMRLNDVEFKSRLNHSVGYKNIVTFHHGSWIKPSVHVVMIQQMRWPGMKRGPESKATKRLAGQVVIWGFSRLLLKNERYVFEPELQRQKVNAQFKQL